MMIERVARAIAHAQLKRHYVGNLRNIGATIEIDKTWPDFIPEGRAAIEAMRIPTRVMTIEAEKRGAGEAWAEDTWQAMIDRALEG